MLHGVAFLLIFAQSVPFFFPVLHSIVDDSTALLRKALVEFQRD